MIYVKGRKNNFDLDFEGLSAYPDEEEVLFLPFCIFNIESIEDEEIGKKKIKVVKLVETEDKNPIDEKSFIHVNSITIDFLKDKIEEGKKLGLKLKNQG